MVVSMIRKSGVWLVLFVCLCVLGCTEETTEDQEYDEMLEDYDLYTVSGLWTAIYTDGTDLSSTYLLLRGEVDDMPDSDETTDRVVTLIDSEGEKVIDCTFDDDYDEFDLSSLVEGYTVTILGICRYETDTEYIWLESCNYLYVNSTDTD